MRFGIGRVTSNKKCNYWECRKQAKIFIGDKRQPYQFNNYCLCEEHARQLLKALTNKYGSPDDKVVSNDLKVDLGKEFIDELYKDNLIVKKDSLVKFCEEHNIELENKEKIRVKEIFELIFPNIKGEVNETETTKGQSNNKED